MRRVILFFSLLLATGVSAQHFQISSPDGRIQMEVSNEKTLSYSVVYKNKVLVADSPLGFEFKDEKPMQGNFALLNVPQAEARSESWIPVVKNKHEEVQLHWNEMTFNLEEKEGDRRRMDFVVRVYDEGVAFRYQLYGGRKIGNRQITKELTGFSLPADATGWAAKYKRNYTSSQESEFVKTTLNYLPADTVAGLPFLVEVDKQNYVAITEACIDDYPGFYIGKGNSAQEGNQVLATRLSPLPGEKEDGVKARFFEKMATPWRVILVGDHPG